MMLCSQAQRERGMSVLLVIALLAIMFALIMAGTQSLAHLKSELKQIERDQTNRLATDGPRAP